MPPGEKVLGSTSISGRIYGQLLYKEHVTTSGGTPNLLFAATNTNDVYALQAPSAPGAFPSLSVVWHRSPTGASGIGAAPSTSSFGCNAGVAGTVGIIGELRGARAGVPGADRIDDALAREVVQLCGASGRRHQAASLEPSATVEPWGGRPSLAGSQSLLCRCPSAAEDVCSTSSTKAQMPEHLIRSTVG
jgi:hypothetical protein